VSDIQYGRDDVDYQTWYSDWMKSLAKRKTRRQLETMLHGKSKEAEKSANSHLRAIERSTSMSGNSMSRAHARNVTAAAGDAAIAIRGALEIYDLFPEHTKETESDE